MEENISNTEKMIEEIHTKQKEELKVKKEEMSEKIFSSKMNPTILNLEYKIQQHIKNLQYEEA